jgi:uncharacterized protein (TIGR02594 family)
MPYIKGSTSQGNSSRPEIDDVYHSPNVFANNVPIALWLEPVPSAGIAFPEATLVNLSPTQIQGIQTSAAQAKSKAEDDVGLSGVGEVPQEGPVVTGQGTPDVGLTGNIFMDLKNVMDLCLSEARQGLWKENGANPRIVATYKAVGSNVNSDGAVPWCAAYAGSTLKKAAAAFNKSLGSRTYTTYGTAVPLADKSKWRLNDVVIFIRDGGGHIGFFRGYNPNTGVVAVAGGNQGNNLSISGYAPVGPKLRITDVRRAWTIPAEFDKPIADATITPGKDKRVL